MDVHRHPGKRVAEAFRRAAMACLAAARAAVGTLRRAAGIYLDAHAFDHAASISFFALLSVAPLLILLVSAFGYLAVLVGSAEVEGMISEVAETVRGFAPVIGDKVSGVAHALIERRGRFGLFGALVMILGASMVFGALEHAMEDVFRVRVRRKFLVSRALFSVVLAVAGFIAFVLHHAQTVADSIMLARMGMTLDEWLRESTALDAALTFLPVPVGFLAALYIPGIVRVPLRHGLAGAAIFFVLWESAREIYAFYVTSIAGFGVLYGSLATPILLVLWTFYSANILLFSMAFVAAMGRDAKNDLQ